jgi:hypothetical protein
MTMTLMMSSRWITELVTPNRWMASDDDCDDQDWTGKTHTGQGEAEKMEDPEVLRDSSNESFWLRGREKGEQRSNRGRTEVELKSKKMDKR